MRVRLFIIAILASGAATAAFAQEAPVARAHEDSAALTGPPPVKATPPADPTPAPAGLAAKPPISSSDDTTSSQIAEWLKADASPVQPLDPRDPGLIADPGPRQIHGEVGAYVSNRGYGGYAATSVPLGQASELDLAVSGEHIRTRWGNANPRTLAVGLRLDGGDVGRWLSHDKCNVPRWGVSLPGDPQVLADGSCAKTAAEAPLSPAP